MSIDMYVGSSQAQAASVRAICRQQRQGYQQLQQAISSFVVSSDQLQGKTYDSAKQYFATVLTPLAKGGMLLTEAVEKACKKLPEEYQSQVDSGDLKQSELEEKIRQFEAHIATTNAIIQNFSRLPENTGVSSGIERSLKNVLRTQEKGKQELEKKRRKLLEFNARSASFFSEIAALEAAVNKGAEVSGTCWNSSTGTFILPSKNNMAWVGEINGYEARAKKRAEKEKIAQLEKYDVYAVPCRDPEGKPTVMWLLEDPKTGRKVNNPELIEYLNKKGSKLDPSMFQILTLDGFEEKVAASWREGVEYFSGKEYTGWQKAGMQGLQGIQDFAESDFADALRLLGFAYGTYRITTASGVQEVVVSNPKVTKVSNKNFKNATLVSGKNTGSYTKVGVTGQVEKVSGAKSSGEDLFNYTNKVNEHMANPDRAVPAQTLKEAIKGGTPMPDPRGSSATMYYSEIYINGKQYNFEVLYDKPTNTIYHFKYDRRPLGPLPAVPKQ